MNADYTFCINKATEKELEQPLIINSETAEFSEFVKTTGYVHKIFTYAERYEVWDKSILVGIVAAYFNYETKIVFITHVRVCDEYKHQGIALFLLEKVIERAEKEDFVSVELEVKKGNVPAQTLYEKLGFVVTEENKINGKDYMNNERIQ